jgi:hypothetical protein
MSDEKVILFPGETTLDIPPDRVLDGALGKLDTVLVIGKDLDGGLYLAASTNNGGELFLLIERCKAEMVRRIELGNGNE